jgi:hypothetical protein
MPALKFFALPPEFLAQNIQRSENYNLQFSGILVSPLEEAFPFGDQVS